MEYRCLQDVLDEIYYDKDEFWSSDSRIYDLKEFGTIESLLEALSKYFNMWDQGERGENYTKKLGNYTEYERASHCFLYIFQVLPMFEDPSIIAELMQYFPPEGPDQWPWTMEDMWTEIMLQNIASYHYYGANYIPWIMKSFKNLRKGAEWVAEDLMFSMIFDTFERITPDVFPDLPVIDALPLGDRGLLKDVLEYRVNNAYKYVCDLKREIETELFEKDKLEIRLERLRSITETLVCTEYVLGQLLALPENVVPLHASD